jgi:hypothetical protein
MYRIIRSEFQAGTRLQKSHGLLDLARICAKLAHFGDRSRCCDASPGSAATPHRSHGYPLPVRGGESFSLQLRCDLGIIQPLLEEGTDAFDHDGVVTDIRAPRSRDGSLIRAAVA